MYDRKTWIVIGLCSALLAVNLYYSNKKQQAERERQAAERKALAEQTVAAEPDPADPAAAQEVAEKPGVLEEPPAPPVDEVLTTIETEGAVFTLTNIGGGVKESSIKEQFEVGSEDVSVRINSFSSHAVGVLSDGVDRFDGLPFSTVVEESGDDRIVYRATNRDGLEITKSFAKAKAGEPGGEYLLEFELTLRNTGAAPMDLDRWTLSLGSAAPLYQREWEQQTTFFWRRGGKFDSEAASKFKGGWFRQSKSVIERELESLEYAGVSNQFFATVLQPAESVNSGVWAKVREIRLEDGGDKTRQAIRGGLRLPAEALAPGESKTLSYRLFMGPKHNRMLRQMGDGFGDVMNYGLFSPFSRFLNWLLFWIHEGMDKVSGKWSWGIAIIVLTIIVRGAMWPLQNASTRTMKRMSKLKPEMDKLKAKYPDDPNRMNQEMMQLYKKYRINPMGGCLPLFVQIPIFFGFYRMLQYAVELRHNGFLWVSDLSQPDTVATVANVPINLLPILMGLSSFGQIAMTPKTGDKNQQRIMMFMPLMFFFFCYNFASALALYWTTSNLFAMGQTWLMSKLPEPELKARKGGAKKGWVERIAAKQEELQRSQKDRASGKAPASADDKPKKKRPPRTGG